MNQYDKQIKSAKIKIADKGQLVTWIVNGEPQVTNLDKPWLVENKAPVSYQVRMLFLPNSRIGYETDRPILNSSIKIGSIKGLMASVPFVPSSKDLVIRNGITYEIETIDTLNPSGSSILHTIVFKG